MASDPKTVRGPAFATETSRRRLLADRAARWVVSAGGLTIVLSVLGILVFILVEVAPLMGRARVERSSSFALPAEAPAAIVGDEYRTLLVTLSLDGVARVFRTGDGGLVSETPVAGTLAPGGALPLAAVQAVPGAQTFAAATGDGKVLIVPVLFETSYEEGTRSVAARIAPAVVLDVDPGGGPLRAFAAREDAPRGLVMAAGVLSDGSLAVVRRERRENELTGEVTSSESRLRGRAPAGTTHLLVDAEQRNLYGGAATGEVAWWPLGSGESLEMRSMRAGFAPVTAMTLLLGDRSVVVGLADGSLGVWFLVRQEDETFDLTRIRDFPRSPGGIRLLSPSSRGKDFLAQDDRGTLGLYGSTSHRVLWRGASPLAEATAAFYLPKSDGAYLATGGRAVTLRVHNPHPEVSLEALFGKIWYEGYGRPEFVWQSSSGTDDFEPKLSLTPLLVGTLKGTVFSLLLAIPLGVLAAMYASQFMQPGLKRFVKPTVEIMAALPSVVLGFLAGLWLAPRVERVIPGLLLMVPVLTLLVLLGRYLWHLVPRSLRGRLPVGSEVGIYFVLLAAGMWGCLRLSPALEAGIFGGSFPTWLLHATGLSYDQRNAVVVGLAMGFAVIPIIFAIAEDAFSNVPRNLVSGSLALGANRWQTVTRVVLPTASPGIFSAIMIGFGRAVGETMIVLMATGNTPILDWNPFNGFRTLSANIAVEISEAPQGGTLYRTLFLAALLLFVVTFVVNTAAELVRQRLRRRYAQL